MHRVLPILTSIESVDFGSSESEFGASVSSTILAWALEKSPSDSWINSIWNAIVGNKCKVLYLSIAFLHDKVVNSLN